MMFSTPAGYVNGITLDLTKSYLITAKIIAASSQTKCIINSECPIFYYNDSHLIGDKFDSIWYPTNSNTDSIYIEYVKSDNKLQIKFYCTDTTFMAQAYVEIYEFSVQVAGASSYSGAAYSA